MSRFTPPRPRLRDPELEKMARIATLLGGARMMGAPAPPLTSQSQQITPQVSATSSASGTATFTFPAPPQGFTWTGTVSVDNAPTSAVFVAMIGATQWGDWGGNSVAGPFQAFANQQLVVTATGLIANTNYVMTWTGSSDPSDAVGAIWPEPNVSALTAEITGAPPEELAFGTNATNILVAGLVVPASTRTLIIKSTLGGIDNLIVTGLESNEVYYDQPPYLGNLPNTGVVYVPFNPVIDTTVTIKWNNALINAGQQYAIYSDTQIYDESLFYNGVAVAATASLAAAGTTTILTGPARLLSWSVQASGGASANLQLGGTDALAGDTNASNANPFPPNSILEANATVVLQQVGAGASRGTVVYAYP